LGIVEKETWVCLRRSKFSSRSIKLFIKTKFEGSVLMVSILPPPERKDYKTQKEYKNALKEWEKMFKRAKKHMFDDGEED